MHVKMGTAKARAHDQCSVKRPRARAQSVSCGRATPISAKMRSYLGSRKTVQKLRTAAMTTEA